MSRQLLTFSEVATVLGVSRGKMYSYLEGGSFPSPYSSAKGKFWSADELRGYINAHILKGYQGFMLKTLDNLTGED